MNGSDTSDMQPKRIDNFRFIGYTISEISSDQRPDRRICPWLRAAALSFVRDFAIMKQTSVYKGYKQDKIEMRGDRAEMSDFPLYLNTVAGGLDRRDQTIGGFSFVVKIYAVPVVEIIG